MNVIVSNKQKNILDNANIDAIKELTGFFQVDDLINNFKNYFFTKMVIDATSVVEFANPEVLKKLVSGIGAEKLVILLPQKPEPPKSFLDLLIDLGIYNFSSNINDVIYFLQNPNTRDSIIHYLENGMNRNIDGYNEYGYSNNEIMGNSPVMFNDILDNRIGNENTFGYNMNDDTTEENTYGYDMNDDTSEENTFGYDINDDTTEENSFSYNVNNRLSNQKKFNYNMNVGLNDFNKGNKYIIGIRNATKHAGTTSLIYMLKNTLQRKFNNRVLAIEIGSIDFHCFKDKDMISIDSNNLEKTIRNSEYDVILIDLNKNQYDYLCNEVFYLLEPSIVSINRLIYDNRMAFVGLKNKKVILNKSMISKNDIVKFARESQIPFFFVLPPLNERVENSILEVLLKKIMS